MNWFPYLTLLHFGAFILYLSLAIRVLYYSPKSSLNKITAYLLLCFALWSFIKVFSHNVNTPKNIVIFMENIFSFSWILIPSLAFYFFSSQTKNENITKNKKLLLFIITFSVFLYFLVLKGFMFKDFELKEYGWFRPWKNNIWVILFYIYFVSFTSTGLILLIKDYLKIKNKIKKKIHEVFIFASIGSFILCLSIEMLEILFYKFNLKKGALEDIPDLYLIIFALALIYLISRYRYMKISPIYAADTIISSMNESLIITDDEIDIVFMNETAKKIFTQSTDKYSGKEFSIFFKNRNDINHLLKEIIKNDFIRNFESEFITSENKTIPVLISGSVIKEMGEMIGFVFIISDITEFKKAQRVLKESYEKLVEVDALKTNFLSMVSHELRTPLTTILGFLSLILGGATGRVPEYLKDPLETMQKNADRLLSLINDLLDISKLEAGTFTISRVNNDLIHLINESIKNLRPLCSKKNITISFDTTIKSLKINIDPTRILQVINNLISNAIKFSKNNSKILILAYIKSTKDLKIPEYIDVSLLKSENYAIVKIIDEGKGIEQKNLSKIFDRFFQAEDINTRKAQGAGLGLYIAKEIISMHDGLIFAESEGIDKGSTFTILLPID